MKLLRFFEMCEAINYACAGDIEIETVKQGFELVKSQSSDEANELLHEFIDHPLDYLVVKEVPGGYYFTNISIIEATIRFCVHDDFSGAIARLKTRNEIEVDEAVEQGKALQLKMELIKIRDAKLSARQMYYHFPDHNTIEAYYTIQNTIDLLKNKQDLIGAQLYYNWLTSELITPDYGDSTHIHGKA